MPIGALENIESEFLAQLQPIELDDPDDASAANAATLGHVAALLARFKAGSEHASAATVGDFAKALQAIEGELQLMAQSQGVADRPANSDVDWAEILAAADAMGANRETAVAFTPEELQALALRT